MTLAPGTRLGSYTIRSLLGIGGMGEVYEAVDSTRNLRVALKRLQHLESDGLLRFKQEFRTLAGVAHPNLVMLYELVAEADRWFFTMELVEGLDLLEYVWGTGTAASGEWSVPSWSDRTTQPHLMPARHEVSPIPAAIATAPQPTRADLVTVWRAFRQLAEGLAAIHAEGKLHRDIKPSNIKVTPDGRVVVLDFGLITEVRNAAGWNVIGTLGYMSPEQAAGGVLFEASDWYSFGVVLYLALTGRLPFEGPANDPPFAQPAQLPVAPSQLVTGVPPALERFTMALLDHDPVARPSGTQIRTFFATTDPAVTSTRPEAAAPIAADHPSRSVFVGRRQELHALHAALGAVADGVPVVALVSGRSGIGKTALISTFLDTLTLRQDVVVLRGRCFQQEAVPYKAVDAIVDALSRYLEPIASDRIAAVLPRDVAALATIFPVLQRIPSVVNAPRRFDRLDEQELRRRAFVAFKELLARIGDRATLILTIDDLQWGDSDSAALLSEVLRPPDAPGILLLGSHRSEETDGPVLRALREAAAAQRGVPCVDVRLEPLDDTDAVSLATSVLPAGTSRPEVMAIVREAGGDPFFLQELSASVSERGRQAAAASAPTLDHSILDRVSRLSPDLQRYLHIVAVAGRPIADAHALKAAGVAADLGIVTTLRARRLIGTTGSAGRVEVNAYHDRIRESVLAGLDPDERRRLHGQLAETLDRAGAADDETLAVHYDHAGDATRARPRYVAAAARAARALAFNRAASLYQRALRLGEDDGHALRIALGDALANAGRALDAAQAYEQAAADSIDTAGSFELQRRAGYCYACCGRVVEGKKAFNQALARFGMRLPKSAGETLARLIAVQLRLRLRGMHFTERPEQALGREELARIDAAWSVGTGLGLVDIAPGALFTSYALLLALKGGEPRRIARTLAWEAATASSMNAAGQKRAVAWLRTCDALADRFADPYLRAMTDLAHGIAAYGSGDWRTGIEKLGAAGDRFEEECPGSNWERTAARGFLFRTLLNVGHYRTLAPLYLRVRQTAIEVGDQRMYGFLGAYIGPNLSLASDNPAEARRSVHDAVAGWAEQGFFMHQAVAGQATPMIHLYEGDAAAARAALAGVWPDFARHHYLANMAFRRDTLEIRSRVSIALAARSRDAKALEQAKRDCRVLSGLPSPYLAAHVLAIQGAAAAIAGDHVDARRQLAEAADRFEATFMDAAAGSARYVLGTISGDTAMVASAVAALQAQAVANVDRFARMLIPGYLSES